MLSLISKAYSSIRLQDLSAVLGLNQEDTLAKIASLGWPYEPVSGFVSPTRLALSPEDASPASFDQLMTKLTEYVAFLEN